MATTDGPALSVYIVDDCSRIRKRLIELLSEMDGVKIIGEAETAGEAIEAIRHLRPALVILDLGLGLGSGLSVLTAIKADRPAPVVAVLTNYSYPQYRNRCLAMGADFFIDKTTGFEAIADIVRQTSRQPR